MSSYQSALWSEASSPCLASSSYDSPTCSWFCTLHCLHSHSVAGPAPGGRHDHGSPRPELLAALLSRPRPRRSPPSFLRRPPPRQVSPTAPPAPGSPELSPAP